MNIFAITARAGESPMLFTSHPPVLENSGTGVSKKTINQDLRFFIAAIVFAFPGLIVPTVYGMLQKPSN